MVPFPSLGAAQVGSQFVSTVTAAGSGHLLGEVVDLTTALGVEEVL